MGLSHCHHQLPAEGVWYSRSEPMDIVVRVAALAVDTVQMAVAGTVVDTVVVLAV